MTSDDTVPLTPPPQRALTDAEHARLRKFRRLAEGIHVYVDRHWGITFSVHWSTEEGSRVSQLPDEVLDALAVRVRNAYGDSSDTHFFSICNILVQCGSDLERRLSIVARRGWQRVLQRPFILHDATASHRPEDILRAFLYGELTHQHDKPFERLQRIRQFGEMADLILHGTVWHLAQLVIALDSVVASILGESALPRGPALPLSDADVSSTERAAG